MYTVFAFSEGSMSKGESQKEEEKVLEEINSKVAVLKGDYSYSKTYEISLFLYRETLSNINIGNLKLESKKKSLKSFNISTIAWTIANKMEKYGNQAAKFYIVVLDCETILNSQNTPLFRYTDILTRLDDITASIEKMLNSEIVHLGIYQRLFYEDLKKSVEDYKATQNSNLLLLQQQQMQQMQKQQRLQRLQQMQQMQL